MATSDGKCTFSEQSCHPKFQLFQRMCPDSGILKSSSMQGKFTYTINFFGVILFSLIYLEKQSLFFKLSFDKTVNDHLENIQTDLVIIFWNQKTKKNTTRYCG